MPTPPLDLTGQRFGRLVAVERDGKLGQAQAWRCLCDCGRSDRRRAGALRAGQATQCAICAKEAMGRRRDLSGRTFGLWRVVTATGRGAAGEVKWTCVCGCGAVRDLSANDLLGGRTTACKSCAAKLRWSARAEDVHVDQLMGSL